MGNSITIEDPAVQCYALCSSILVMKMLIMSLLTTRRRFAKDIFASPEDDKFFGTNTGSKKNDPDIERIRRAHLNDLENIPAFIFISGMYLLTSPAYGMASLLMKTYTGCRILYSLVYAVYPVPQPTRAILWGIGYAITFYMAAKVAIHFI